MDTPARTTTASPLGAARRIAGRLWRAFADVLWPPNAPLSPTPEEWAARAAAARRRPMNVEGTIKGVLALIAVLAISATVTVAAGMAWGIGGLIFGLGFCILIWVW